MEAPEYLHGGYSRGGNPQFAMDKQGGKPGEAFAVEDLLDFSNEDDGLCGGGGGEDELGLEAAPDDSTLTALDSSSNSSSGGDPHFPADLACRGFPDGLSVPYDEIAELEWLSNFVEESFSSEDLQRLQLISGVGKSSSSSAATSGSRGEAAQAGVAAARTLFPSETHVPGKARSKRSRPAPSSWSSRLLVLSPATSSSESDAVVTSNPGAAKKVAPKPGKKREAGAEGGPGQDGEGRRCLHCATEKTPQWRTGPMGPKTLCNACGVRYKSGRLVPEYRPAASPTFVPSRHSNSHRKVIELRRQKELQHHPHHHHHHGGGGGAQFLHPGGFYDPPAGGSPGDDLLLHHHLGPDFRQLL